jgi:hypothetical protein
MVKTIRIPGKGPIQIYSDTAMFITVPGDGPVEVVAAGGPSGDAILGEDGFYILQEDGSYILVET